jgi:hypothetical protein
MAMAARLLTMFAMAICTSSCSILPSDGEARTMLFLISAAPVAFGASAVHGFSVARACSKARKEWMVDRATLRYSRPIGSGERAPRRAASRPRATRPRHLAAA